MLYNLQVRFNENKKLQIINYLITSRISSTLNITIF